MSRAKKGKDKSAACRRIWILLFARAKAREREEAKRNRASTA